MKKYVIAISMLIALPVAAQETYENANIVTEELNSTSSWRIVTPSLIFSW